MALGAVFLTAPMAPALSQTAAQTRWAEILAAAKVEGKVVVSYFTDPASEPILRLFEQKYGIKVEGNADRPNSIIPKMLTEQKNGQFNWDVLLQPVNNVRIVLEPAGGLEPILPFLILPEVTDDANWYGGLTGNVAMNPMYVFYDGISNLGTGIDVNRDKFSHAQFNNWPDLLAPEFKKKFGIYYPGRPSNLTISLACYRPALDSDAKWEAYVRAFFAQEPLSSPEFRIVADWLIQGRFDVAVGADGTYLDTIKVKLKRNIEDPVGDNFCGYSPQGTGRSSAITVPKNPPHRNAATVFVNWYLSKEAQEALVKSYSSTGENSFSRRTDVGHPDPAAQQKAVSGFQNGWLKGKGLMTDSDVGLKLQQKVIEIAREAGY